MTPDPPHAPPPRRLTRVDRDLLDRISSVAFTAATRLDHGDHEGAMGAVAEIRLMVARLGR